MNKQRLLHFLGLLAVAALGVVVDVLTDSHWHWAPIALALAVNLRTALTGSSAMKVGVLLVALPFLGGATCTKTIVNGPTPPADAGTFTDCSDSALHASELNLLPAIQSALALTDYSSVESAIVTALLPVAAQVGWPLAWAEANCVVRYLLDSSTKQFALTADDIEKLKVANANRWLAAHPSNVTGTVK